MYLPLTCHSQCCSPSTDSNLLSYTEFSEPSASSSLTCNFSIGQWWGKRGQTALVAYETGKQEIHGNPGYLLIPHTKITSNAQSLCVRLWLDRIFLDTDPVYKLSRARTSLLRIKGGTPCSINVEVQVGILSLNMDVGTIWFSWGNWNPSYLVDPPWVLVYMEPDQMPSCMAKCISMESDQEVVPQEVKKFKKHR